MFHAEDPNSSSETPKERCGNKFKLAHWSFKTGGPVKSLPRYR